MSDASENPFLRFLQWSASEDGQRSRTFLRRTAWTLLWVFSLIWSIVLALIGYGNPGFYLPLVGTLAVPVIVRVVRARRNHA